MPRRCVGPPLTPPPPSATSSIAPHSVSLPMAAKSDPRPPPAPAPAATTSGRRGRRRSVQRSWIRKHIAAPAQTHAHVLGACSPTRALMGSPSESHSSSTARRASRQTWSSTRNRRPRRRCLTHRSLSGARPSSEQSARSSDIREAAKAGPATLFKRRCGAG